MRPTFSNTRSCKHFSTSCEVISEAPRQPKCVSVNGEVRSSRDSGKAAEGGAVELGPLQFAVYRLFVRCPGIQGCCSQFATQPHTIPYHTTPRRTNPHPMQCHNFQPLSQDAYTSRISSRAPRRWIWSFTIKRLRLRAHSPPHSGLSSARRTLFGITMNCCLAAS